MAQNFLGALDLLAGDDDELGAFPAFGRYRGRARRSARGAGYGGYGGRAPQSAWMNAASNRANAVAAYVRPDLPGAPARDAAMLPASFPVFSFALATGTNIITQQMNPQTAFRGQRLSCIVIRNGTSAATTAPLLRTLQVGMKPIILTPDGVALETFNQSAYDTNLLLPPTVPGTVYVANISLALALTTTDTILAILSVIGSAVL